MKKYATKKTDGKTAMTTIEKKFVEHMENGIERLQRAKGYWNDGKMTKTSPGFLLWTAMPGGPVIKQLKTVAGEFGVEIKVTRLADDDFSANCSGDRNVNYEVVIVGNISK